MKMKTIENPNKELVYAIRERLKVTGNHCPCIPETQWNEDTKCMCKEFKEHQDIGMCHCQLYIKVKA